MFAERSVEAEPDADVEAETVPAGVAERLVVAYSESYERFEVGGSARFGRQVGVERPVVLGVDASSESGAERYDAVVVRQDVVSGADAHSEVALIGLYAVRAEQLVGEGEGDSDEKPSVERIARRESDIYGGKSGILAEIVSYLRRYGVHETFGLCETCTNQKCQE